VFASEVACGEFAELRHLIRPRLDLSLQEIAYLPHIPALAAYYREKCTDFLHRLDDNFCINVDGHAYSGWLGPTPVLDVSAWCYVSSECQDLNGGRRIGDKHSDTGQVIKRGVSAKICTAGQDVLMREKTPEELRDLVARIRKQHPGEGEGLSLGFVALEAYQALGPDLGIWKTIRPMFMNNWMVAFPPPLQVAVIQNRPMVIYVHPEDHDHYKIMWGGKVIHLDKKTERAWWGLGRTGNLSCPDTIHCYMADKHEL